LRKLIAIVIAAVVVAAAGIGIGLAAFPKTSPQASNTTPGDNTQIQSIPNNNTQRPSIPTASEGASDSNDDINSLDNIPGYVGLVDLGYSDATALYLSSVKLDLISSNNTYYHYVQTTPNGTRAETILSYSPNEQFDTTDHQMITVTPGFDIYAKDVKVEKLDQGYHVVISYFVPADSTPYDLEEYLNPVQPVSAELPFGMQFASAAGTQIYGTGVTLDTTVITPIESANTVVSPPRITAAPVEDVGGTLQRQQTADIAREVQQMIMDRELAVQEAAEASQRAGQTADRLTRQAVDQAIQDQLRQQRIDLNRVADRAAREEAAETLSRTSGRVVTGLATAWSLYNILDDHFRISGSIDAARDCYNNPTNPLAQDAQRNDPHYNQLGENLDTAQEGLYVTTGARVGVQGFETAAGASTGFAGGLAIGSVSQGMDAMLWNSQMSEISDALRGITPCTPCPEDPQSPPPAPPQPEGDHTPGPNEPGFYYTMGPRESYEPPERKICRTYPNQVTLTVNEVVNEGEGTPRVVTFQANANVTMNHYTLGYAGGTSTYYYPDFFSGNGTGYYHSTFRYIQQDRDYLWCNVETAGLATMQVGIARHKEGPQMSLAEVSISIVGDLPITEDPAGCFNGLTSTGTDAHIYGCNFYDVSESGGTYHNGTGPDNDRLGAPESYYDDCQLIMGPLVEPANR
jgi:hypothetical protein